MLRAGSTPSYLHYVVIACVTSTRAVDKRGRTIRQLWFAPSYEIHHAPSGSGGSIASGPLASVYTAGTNVQTPRATTWNLGAQRQFPGQIQGRIQLLRRQSSTMRTPQRASSTATPA